MDYKVRSSCPTQVETCQNGGIMDTAGEPYLAMAKHLGTSTVLRVTVWGCA